MDVSKFRGTESKAHFGSRDGEEADAQHHAADRDLPVAELDAVQIQHAQTVGTDQAVQGEDLVHLDCRHQRASSLADDVRNRHDVRQLAREWSRDGRIAQLDARGFIFVNLGVHHLLRQLASQVGDLLRRRFLLVSGAIALNQSLRRRGRDGWNAVGLRYRLACLGRLLLRFTQHGCIVVRIRGSRGI